MQEQETFEALWMTGSNLLAVRQFHGSFRLKFANEECIKLRGRKPRF